MNGTIKTLEQARNYAENIERITGNKHHIFHVPNGTGAHNIGYRYATCLTSEVELYKAEGAVFVEGEVDDSKERTTEGGSETA